MEVNKENRKMDEILTIMTVLDDPRPIDSIHWDEEGDPNFTVGRQGVTEIRAYGEPGEHCFLPWLAVFIGERIICRVPAQQVLISYYQGAPEMNE